MRITHDNNRKKEIIMDKKEAWKLFKETVKIEYYLIYKGKM